MTPLERREFLKSRGFDVAREAFPGHAFPQTYYLREVDPRGTVTKYFIDLDSGRWQLWGGPWQDFDAGPWNELVEPETQAASTVTRSDLNQAFLDRCLAAGLQLDPDHKPGTVNGRDLGNRFMRLNGARYLVVTAVERILDRQGNTVQLDDLSAQTTVHRTTPAFETARCMEFGKPVEMAGARKQKALF